MRVVLLNMVWPVILSAVGPLYYGYMPVARASRRAKTVADELWRMATEYQDQAARLGEAPELGDEPPLWKLAR